MGTRLFGTDGVRGIANEDLSCELAMQIGMAGAQVLTSEVHNPRILVGRDTRRSGDMLAAALMAGICSVGGDVIDVGVIPTPAMAYLVRLYEADAAVMVSASHNPMEYNGVKWFNGQGFKLSDALEDEIERLIKAPAFQRPVGEEVGHIINARRAREEYKEFLISSATTRFDGITVVLDCANGASSGIAAEVFSALGANVIPRADEPDGSNINDGCGSTHPERLQELVTESGADVGFAFDGDADRCLAVDENGSVVNGDKILYVCARNMQTEGRFGNSKVVTTVMSNLGLYKALDEAGIGYEKTAVGDKYVAENMRANGHLIGGEQSGHIIFGKYANTGDGLLTAIKLMQVMLDRKKTLSELAAPVREYPQQLTNVEVDDKDATLNDPAVIAAEQTVTERLGDEGRILVRKSGTEPVLRVMVEAATHALCEENVASVIDAMQKSGHLIRVR